jgi:DMSO/TMAO reductase YedYZ molybdopterin-dependent catalytic subunit
VSAAGEAPLPGPEGTAAADAIRLIRAWGRGDAPPAPRARALDLLAFARTHRVGWVVAAGLAPALPEAAGMLLRPVLAEAEARAEALAVQFRGVAGLLREAGLHPVALKGAAILAEAGGAPVPWREMVDLDLLVVERDLPRAVAALQAAGYHGDARAHVATDYHFPALFPPEGGPASVELHARPGWSRRGPLARLERRARESATPGVRVPAPEDRLAHLVHHAQIGDRGWARRTVRLRDMLDWRAVRQGHGIDLEDLAVRFDAAGQGAAFRAHAALMARFWDESAPAGWAEAHEAWGEAALAALGDPALAEARRKADAAPAALEALTTRETLMHAAAGSLNPARLRRFLRRLRP